MNRPVGDADLDPISARMRAEERRLRVRVMTLTLVALVIGLGLIAVTTRQVAVARAELGLVQDSTEQLRQETDLLGQEVVTRLEALESARRTVDSLAAEARAYEAWIDRRNTAAADSIKRTAARQFQAEPVTPRVYLHILDENQRAPARRLVRALQAAGFDVPGIELVSTGPRSSEVRFFMAGDDRGAARVRQVVADAGTQLGVKDLTARYGRSATIRPGHYEIWLGPEFR